MIKILLAVDGSEHSQRAVAFAAKLAQAGTAVELHVLNVQIPVDSGHVRMFVEADLIEAYYREEGLRALQPACEALDAAGVEYLRHLAVGHIAETIAHYADKLDADQVVMGSHGRGALSHLLLGSVASDVVRRLDRPVTLVK